MTELLFNNTCALLVLERAPDPELDDEGDRVAGKGEAARERGDERGASHFFVSYDATGLANGVDIRNGPRTPIPRPIIHMWQFIRCLQPRAHAKKCCHQPTRAIIQALIVFGMYGEMQRRSPEVIHRINVSASSQQVDDTITTGLGGLAPDSPVQGTPHTAWGAGRRARVEQEMDSAQTSCSRCK